MKTGLELLAEIAQYPTLDGLLDRDIIARPLTDTELELEVKRQRAERAFILLKETAKKDKKAGVEQDEAE